MACEKMADHPEGKAWSPEGMTQDDFMLKDECIIVNYMDEVVGHDNKYNAHKFVSGQPRGILHRAFSVMLFDAEGNLLLQQRAASKITFPYVWTNTCCSHPLFGMVPREVDTPEEIATGSHMGVKHAAIRKLGHELGIPAPELDADRFKFMTRVHYWAADVGTYGSGAPWGEHEIDHLLLYQLLPGETLTLAPHVEEVMATRWISREDLRSAMNATDDKLTIEFPLWSPWFRIIATRLLDDWWADLEKAISTDQFVDVRTIHRFDTPSDFHGGAGRAQAVLNIVAEEERIAWKEGGHAKRRKVVLGAEREDLVSAIRAHSARGQEAAPAKAGAAGDSASPAAPRRPITQRLSEFFCPLEKAAVFRLKYRNILEDNMQQRCTDPDIQICNDIMGRTSPWLAAVVRQLPNGMCLDACIYFLVLRALETLEATETLHGGDEEKRRDELRGFADNRLMDIACCIRGVGDGADRSLLLKLGSVTRIFRTLPSKSRAIIADIVKRLGASMADRVGTDLRQGTADLASYERHCHISAGLACEGFARLAVSRGLEEDIILGRGEKCWDFVPESPMTESSPKSDASTHSLALVNSVALFLKKTEIIRDYLKEYVAGRCPWPQDVWKKHATTGELGEFARPTAHGAGKRLRASGEGAHIVGKGVGTQAIACLNEMVGDALLLVVDCIDFLNRIDNMAVYRFWAIPFLLSLATLTDCFDNPLVFTGSVQVRRGLQARLVIAAADGCDAVHWWVSRLVREVVAKGGSDTAVAVECKRILGRTRAKTVRHEADWAAKKEGVCGGLSAAVFALASLGMGHAPA